MLQTLFGNLEGDVFVVEGGVEGVVGIDVDGHEVVALCSLSTYGVEEKIDLTPEESDPSKKKFIKKVTPLDDWITEQTASQG